MRRRRQKYDLYIFIIAAVLLAGYMTYNRFSSEDRGIKAYQTALEIYKNLSYNGSDMKTNGMIFDNIFDNARFCASVLRLSY